ncbi:hypothetical protein [uncultured Cardiobacterium sp.]|uniref:hypothetical protein n=1 Tax=uncultured Cardiobacterium sp. TaxID=417619 RepID=UPI00260F4990|nr:hypothetical protein [uncultured Cardiobacterium sp.]
MIHILILIALGLSAYLFHNYQVFNDAYMRPWVVEQVNYNREADPQALCDLLAPDVVVNVRDEYTRYKYTINNGDKAAACDYFEKSAKNFLKPRREKNGYIEDWIKEYSIDHADLFKDYADVTFTTDTKVDTPASLVTKEGDVLRGKTTTKLTVKSPIFKDSKITRYTFNRKLEQVIKN